MIKDEGEYATYGQPYPHLKDNETEDQMEEVLTEYHNCPHKKEFISTFITDETEKYIKAYNIKPKASA